MQIRVLDLDDSVVRQADLIEQYRPTVHGLRGWGSRVRLGCRFGAFRRFEEALAERLDRQDSQEPALTFYGSGDFHHVSLALLGRLPGPFNLLVLDNHPDWMRGIPFLHCGTWLYHAARLPQVRNIFHVGGNVDFDNGFRRLAPWPMLRSGKITVFPGIRYFQSRRWNQLAHEPVRPQPHAPVTARRLRGLLFTLRNTLKSCPLYISLDKDVLIADQAAVNWDSGHLHLSEVEEILQTFMDAALGRLAGMDIVGDWSPVHTRGLFRRFLHWTEHPSLKLDVASATRRNQRTNLLLLKALARMQAGVEVPAASLAA